MVRRPPQIAVIGTINHDIVIRADGSRSEGYGGILYNLHVLAHTLPDAGIFPVVNIGRDRAPEILGLLAALPQLDLRATRVVPRKNNQCRLVYHDVAAKSERLHGWVGAVSRDQLRQVLNCDLYLVNYISGSDITTASLRWLRDSSPALIYLDFHSRTLGRRANGDRFLRRPRDWRETIACADLLQMNDIEFELLAGAPCREPDLRGFFERHLRGSCRALFVTLGSRGAVCVRPGRRQALIDSIPAAALRSVRDTTGCGDVFAAALVARYLSSGNFIAAARFAVAAASRRAAVQQLSDIDWGQFRKLTLPITGSLR